MVTIFAFSSRGRTSVTSEFVIDFMIFKTIHMIEYGLLFFLVTRALIKTTAIPKKQIFLYAFIFCVLYGLSDEIHQTFIPTRQGTLRDVLIDTVGISVVYWKYAKIV